MKTVGKTVGFGGGFTHAEPMQAECRAGHLVQVRHGAVPRLGFEKDARPKLQLRTGASIGSRQKTNDILTHEPRWEKLCAGLLFAGMFSGILPMALSEALFIAVRAAMSALESLIGSAGMAALSLVIPLAALAASMAYLHRLVFR